MVIQLFLKLKGFNFSEWCKQLLPIKHSIKVDVKQRFAYKMPLKHTKVGGSCSEPLAWLPLAIKNPASNSRHNPKLQFPSMATAFV